MPEALLGLGANLGNPEQALHKALDSLHHSSGIHVEAVSPFIKSQAVGGPADQPLFLNGAARLSVSLSPLDLLDRLHQIELKMGRSRGIRWSARPIDLDLLLYDDLICGPALLGKDASLRLPHPRMAMRRFVLEPANAVAPNWVHPVIGWTVAEMLAHLEHALPYVAIIGSEKKIIFDQIEAHPNCPVPIKTIKNSVRNRLTGSIEKAGLPLPQAIECFHAQLKLHEQAIAASGQGLCLTDFWIGESLLQIETDGAIDSEREILSHLIPPKLLIVLWNNSSHSAQGKLNKTLNQLHSLYRGPLLVLDASDPDRCMEEIIAAFIAIE